MSLQQAVTAEALHDEYPHATRLQLSSSIASSDTSKMTITSAMMEAASEAYQSYFKALMSISEALLSYATARTHFRGPRFESDTSDVIILRAFEEPELDLESQDEAVPSPSASTTLARFQERLKEWRGMLSATHFRALQRHLAHFLGDEDELREEGVTPSLASFDELLRFLKEHSWAKAPAAALDKNGNWSLAWAPKRDAKVNLILTFLGDGRVKWYYYDAERGPKPESLSGLTASDRIDDIFRALQVIDWMAV